jgi:hypothetical protein
MLRIDRSSPAGATRSCCRCCTSRAAWVGDRRAQVARPAAAHRWRPGDGIRQGIEDAHRAPAQCDLARSAALPPARRHGCASVRFAAAVDTYTRLDRAPRTEGSPARGRRGQGLSALAPPFPRDACARAGADPPGAGETRARVSGHDRPISARAPDGLQLSNQPERPPTVACHERGPQQTADWPLIWGDLDPETYPAG